MCMQWLKKPIKEEEKTKRQIPYDYANALSPAICRELRSWRRSEEASWWRAWSWANDWRRRLFQMPHPLWRSATRTMTMRRLLSACRSPNRTCPTGSVPPPNWSAVPRSTVRNRRIGRTRKAARRRSTRSTGAAPSFCGRCLRCSFSADYREKKNGNERRISKQFPALETLSSNDVACSLMLGLWFFLTSTSRIHHSSSWLRPTGDHELFILSEFVGARLRAPWKQK